VKAYLAQLGFPASEVQSPTFLKLLEYRVPGYGLCLHVDGYRLEDEAGTEKLSLESYDEIRALFVEWPEHVEKYLRDRPALRSRLGIKNYWDLDFAEKVGSILEPGRP
jgi:tRNA A37 threonylcarbamoyladenosine biosynthesis protein TsaE